MKYTVLIFLQFIFSNSFSQNKVIENKTNNGLRYGLYQEFDENGKLICDINFQTKLITELKRHEEIISGWKIELIEEFKEINDQPAISLGVHEFKYNFEEKFLIRVIRDGKKIWEGRNPVEWNWCSNRLPILYPYISYDTSKFNQFPRIEGAIDDNSNANYVVEYDSNGELKKITYYSCEAGDVITSIHYYQNNKLSMIEEFFGVNRKLFFADGKINRIESNKLIYTVTNLASSDVEIINFILESTPSDIDSEDYSNSIIFDIHSIFYDYFNSSQLPFNLNNEAHLYHELFENIENESFNMKGFFENESGNFFWIRTYSNNLLIDSLFINNSLFKLVQFSDSSKSIETYYSNGFTKSYIFYSNVENQRDWLKFRHISYEEFYDDGMPKIIANKWMGKFEDNIIFYDNDGSEKSFSFEELENSDSLQKYRDKIESFEYGRSSEYNEAEYNRQQEQAEYESSQAYNNSQDYEINPSSSIQSETKSKPSQPNKIEITKNQVVEEPAFPGGYPALMSYLQKNMKYPQSAIENVIEGKVYVEFYVESDGKISDAKVTIGMTEELNLEALRIVKSMPNWIPGNIDGVKSRLKFTLPINFQLN